MDPHPTTTLLANLDALFGAFFLIAAFGIVATRQVQACMRFFIAQSVFLAATAFVLGVRPFSWHLCALGVINLITKAWMVPYVLRRAVPDEVYTRREITQAVNIPTSLLIALALAVGAHFFTLPWLDAVGAGPAARVNLPIGLAGLLLGAYTLTARREAVPQIIGLLAMENGAFFAGIGVAPSLPLIPEVALAFDVLVLVFIVGVLTRLTHERMGTTAVGELTTLREEGT
jgi:hydrogenase-4 component E